MLQASNPGPGNANFNVTHDRTDSKKQATNMEHYGETGEILRYNIVISSLNRELRQWQRVTNNCNNDDPFAGNIFVNETRRNLKKQKDDVAVVEDEERGLRDGSTNNENQPPRTGNNRYRPKSTEPLRKHPKVTHRIFPESGKKVVEERAAKKATNKKVEKQKMEKEKKEKKEKKAKKAKKAKKKKSGGSTCVLL